MNDVLMKQLQERSISALSGEEIQNHPRAECLAMHTADEDGLCLDLSFFAGDYILMVYGEGTCRWFRYDLHEEREALLHYSLLLEADQQRTAHSAQRAFTQQEQP